MKTKHTTLRGRSIKRLRSALGESQSEFGDRFGAGHAIVSRWESGQRQPNRWVMRLIVELYRSTFTKKKEAVSV